MSDFSAGWRPAVPHIRIAEDGAPFLVGSRCGTCHETFVDERLVCAKCGARDAMDPVHLGETGHIHTYSIVHRSFPGVKTPFVSAWIGLDGGANVQGTVQQVPTDASTPLFGLPVRLVFGDSGQRDGAGIPFLAYYFVPTQTLGGDRA